MQSALLSLLYKTYFKDNTRNYIKLLCFSFFNKCDFFIAYNIERREYVGCMGECVKGMV